jgi:uncharacterized membrane protein
MNLETLTTATLSLGAAAVWGGGDFAGGIATKRANVFRVVAGAHTCGLVLMLLLAWVTREPVPPRSSLEWGLVAGVSGAFGIAALYKALAIGRMGIIAPVARPRSSSHSFVNVRRWTSLLRPTTATVPRVSGSEM